MTAHPGLRVKRIQGTADIWEMRAGRDIRVDRLEIVAEAIVGVSAKADVAARHQDHRFDIDDPEQCRPILVMCVIAAVMQRRSCMRARFGARGAMCCTNDEISRLH